MLNFWSCSDTITITFIYVPDYISPYPYSYDDLSLY